jgi:hypothetical protein
MKIAFFTPRSIEPLHPRLVVFESYFKSRGFVVDFINESGNYDSPGSRVNWLVLWFFDLHAIRRCRKRLQHYDVIFVTDMKYLPLVKAARRMGKIVFYDTIDHNVFLRFYQLQKKIPLIRFIKKPVTSLFMAIEKKYAFNYCHEIIVNSAALREYFENRALTLFYSSPFENSPINNDAKKMPALLYIGAFRYDKSAVEIIELSRQLRRPLFVFGPVEDKPLLKVLTAEPGVTYQPKLSTADLKTELDLLLREFFLFGFSLIKAAHLSYEVQEANKDIDYLALGIPLIGNQRLTTKRKIDDGCGLFVNDPQLAHKIEDQELKARMALQCKTFYRTHYRSDIFNAALDSILRKYEITSSR